MTAKNFDIFFPSQFKKSIRAIFGANFSFKKNLRLSSKLKLRHIFNKLPYQKNLSFRLIGVTF